MLGVSSINRAANIRKIEPFEDSILMFEKLLPLMNVTFVHNGQLTIIPFPFKYCKNTNIKQMINGCLTGAKQMSKECFTDDKHPL